MSRSSHSHSDGGAHAGPAVTVLSDSLRPRIEISGWLCPGGGEAFAPTVGDPHWRTSDGETRTLNTVLAGQGPTLRRALLDGHVDAIAELASAAATLRVDGEMRKARALVAAAARLCNELLARG